MHRFQISTFGSVAIVFAVIGVNQGIFTGAGSLEAMAAGWLILAMCNILWVLYFTSEEDSLALHIFNSMGTGGLTPPSRRRRTRTQSSMHNIQSGNGYTTNYSSGGGIGSNDAYDPAKAGSGAFGSTNNVIRSQNSFQGSLNDGMARSVGGTGAGSIHNQPSGAGSIGGADNGPSSPLMAGIGAGGSGGASATEANPPVDVYSYKAKALYACKSHLRNLTLPFTDILPDVANPEDPNEISFQKGEILDIVDKQGKWWQAKKGDGSLGSEFRASFSVNCLIDPFCLPQLHPPIICK
jgi:SHO1 osmosensor